MRNRAYGFREERPAAPPNYDRAVRLLDDAELEAEILAKRGEAGYQLALIAEHDRRATKEAVTDAA